MTIRPRRQNFHKSNSGVVFKQVWIMGVGQPTFAFQLQLNRTATNWRRLIFVHLCT